MPANEPLTDAQIHALLRALDASAPLDAGALRTALLMAGALRATQAESTQLREDRRHLTDFVIPRLQNRVTALEQTIRAHQGRADRVVLCPQCGHAELIYLDQWRDA